MIDIHHQHDIYAAHGQFGIGLAALYLFHVRDLQRCRPPADGFQHLVLNFYGQHPACLPNLRRNTECEVARAGTQVRHDVPAPKPQGVDDHCGMLLVFALRAIQPGDATRPHHLRDFSTHIELSGAVRVVNLAGLIERPGWRIGNLTAHSERTLGSLRCQSSSRLLALRTQGAGRDQSHRECCGDPKPSETGHSNSSLRLMA